MNLFQHAQPLLPLFGGIVDVCYSIFDKVEIFQLQLFNQ